MGRRAAPSRRRPSGRHLLANGDDLGDTLMAEVKRQRKRRSPEGDSPVEITARDSDWAYQRLQRARRRRGCDLKPSEAPSAPGDECPHSRPRGLQPLADPIPGGAAQSFAA
jgi:hypothetical protein